MTYTRFLEESQLPDNSFIWEVYVEYFGMLFIPEETFNYIMQEIEKEMK